MEKQKILISFLCSYYKDMIEYDKKNNLIIFKEHISDTETKYINDYCFWNNINVQLNLL